jgi:DnaJ like chaperone protein
VNTLAAANSTKNSSNSRPGSDNSFRPRMTREEFVRNLVGALSRLAAADGNISNAEIQLIGAYIAELFPDISTETVKESFKQALDRRSGISFAGCCHKMRIFIGRDYNKAFTVMELFCELAFCDGELSAGEQQLLLQAEQVFELSGFTQIFMARKKYRKSGAASSRNDEECLRILGCQPDATDADIKKAWRSLCHKYHPDKLEGQGASPEEIKEAQAKMQRINEAYESLKASRGMA